MPIVHNASEKQQINNDPAKNVFFIGKELAGNGVNLCMKYAKKVSGLF